jgi:hypothetical protein
MRYLLALLLSACATVSRENETILREAIRCLRTSDSCTTLQVWNEASLDAVIYVNSFRVGEARSWGSTTLYIPDTQLGQRRCAVVTVRQRMGKSGRTTEECARVGGSFHLTIGSLFQTTNLVARGGR